jgi:hypothetical protein
MAIGRDFREANNHIKNETTAHGVTGAIVGTTNTQTLTNKTLTAPNINEAVALTSTSTELNYVDGVTSAIQTQLDSKQPTFTGYDYEIHVSQVDGNDTTGNGDLLKPVATITKALTLITSSRKTVIIHPGTYTESPSITTQYTTLTGPGLIGGNIVISGTVSTSTGCTISGIKMTNLTITTPTGTGNVSVLNCEISGTLTKSSNADYTVLRLCDYSAASITGAGLVAIFGGNPNFTTVNNASANVIIKSAVTVTPVLTAGTLSIVDSVVGAAVTNAVTSSASSIITLANSQFLTSALTGVAPVVLNGFYSILNCAYDKPGSTLAASSGTGGTTNSIDYFQYINADKFITQGGTSSQFVKGDGSLDSVAYAPLASPTFTGTVTVPDSTIATAKIQDSAITSAKIADGTIVNADVNASAAIAYSKLSLNGSITSADIVDGTIVNGDISATAAIAKTKLDLGGTITSADLVDGTIVNSDINASAGIALSKLATDPLARANHTGTQTASTVSDFDTQVRTSKVTDLAAPTGSFSMNSQKITSLATPTTGTDASTKAYVDAQITALVGGAPGTLDTLAEIASAISSGGSFESTVVLKSGSTMTGALTLSGAPTVDLHAATKAYVDTVAGSATAAAASATAAAASYDSFDDRYLGAKSTAPSVDNDGNALGVGAIYWNSVTNQMFAWTGSAWGSISSTADIYRFRFTAAGGETSESGPDDNGLTLAYIPGKEQVYLNGVLLARTSDYTATNGSSITSLAALTAGDILEVITFTAFELADSIARSLFDAKGDLLVATSADTPGKITVGTNGQYLSADSATATGLAWVTPAAGYSAPTLGSTSIASGATVTTIAGLTLTAPTLTGTVTASGDINLSAAGGPGSLIDELTLLLMGAL